MTRAGDPDRATDWRRLSFAFDRLDAEARNLLIHLAASWPWLPAALQRLVVTIVEDNVRREQIAQERANRLRVEAASRERARMMGRPPP